MKVLPFCREHVQSEEYDRQVVCHKDQDYVAEGELEGVDDGELETELETDAEGECEVEADGDDDGELETDAEGVADAECEAATPPVQSTYFVPL
jgi:hypothetical protein